MRIPSILFLSLILTHCTFAQTRFGIKAGIDLASQTNAYSSFNFGPNPGSSPVHLETSNSQTRTGFQGGFFMDIPISGAFIYRQQLLYTMGGGKIPSTVDVGGNPATSPFSYSLKYIQLPAQVLFSPKLSWGRPWIGIGPYAGILLGAGINTGNGSRSVGIGNGSNDGFRRFDVGISPTLGIGLSNGLSLGVDAQLGLVNVSVNPGNYGPFSSTNTRNVIWSVCIAYSWDH